MPGDLTDFQLGLILTAAGATIGAGIITGLIAIFKRLGSFGTWIDDNREPLVAFILSAILVIAAYGSTLTQLGGTSTFSVQGGFAAFLAWYGIAQIAMGVHNTIKSAGSSNEG